MTGTTWNLTTIQYGVGTNGKPISSTTMPGGVATAKGWNNPLLSAHSSGGAQAGIMDAHVRMLNKQTDIGLLKRLATRDDGLQTSDL